jgi:hypothetical protein
MTALAAPKGRLGNGQLRRQVAEYLADHPGPRKTGEIVKALDRSAGAVLPQKFVVLKQVVLRSPQRRVAQIVVEAADRGASRERQPATRRFAHSVRGVRPARSERSRRRR